LGQQAIREWPYRLWQARGKILRGLARGGLTVKRYVDEPRLQFVPEVLAIRDACILNGYWQSERYFESISGQLREEFTVGPAQDTRSMECERRIRQVKSIALHVRRGDYIWKADSNAFHGACSVEYYKAGLDMVCRAWVPTPNCLFFPTTRIGAVKRSGLGCPQRMWIGTKNAAMRTCG